MIRKLLFIFFAWGIYLTTFILRAVVGFLGIKKRSKSVESVLFFTQFYLGNAGYHYRVQVWKDILEKEGIKVECAQLFDENTFVKLTSQPDYLSFLLKAYLKRFFQVWKALQFDCIIIRRALIPYNNYGNLFLDKLLLKLNQNVILDFDDDLSNLNEGNEKISLFGKLLLEDRLTFYRSLELHKRFTPGSRYLRGLIQNHNDKVTTNNVYVLPTCVDYDKHSAKEYTKQNDTVKIGWIGSNNNQIYLNEVIEDLNKVYKDQKLELHVISGKEYSSISAEFDIVNHAWSLEREVELLKNIDIGIMPMPDNKRTRGKCAFKLVQYMGLGIVSASSEVGANMEVVTNGKNGFLVGGQSSWETVLKEILSRQEEFAKIGKNARQRIQDKYCFNAHKSDFIQFIRALN